MKITIYSTTTCQPCRLLARRFDRVGIAYEKIDLDAPERADELAALKARLGVSTLHTPTLEVDGEIVMQGLEPATVARVIEEAA